jgi:alcohol dehydrogenase class IV
LAFSNTKTAAAHSISYPLTINYNIPHGIASSICLIPILKLNKQSIQDSLIQICENNKLTYYQLIEKIKKIPQGVISYSLSDWGITKNQLPMLVEKSFTNDRMDNNIVSITESEVFRILKSVL